MRTTWPRGVLLPALVLLAPPLLGAARSATRRVADPREASTLELPADWQTWADGSRLMALAPGGRSSARLEAAPRTARDLTQFAALMTARWRRTLAGWASQGQALVTVSGHEALLIRAAARPRGRDVVAVHLLAVTPRHQLGLRLACPKSDVDALLPTFQRVMDSWRLTPAVAPRPSPHQEVKDPEGVYAVRLPADWTVERRGAQLLAHGPDKTATVSVTVSPRGAAALAELAASTVRAAKAGDATWHQTGQARLRVSGRDALRVEIESTRAGRPFVEHYVLAATERHELVMVMACPKARWARWDAALRKIADGLALLKGGSPSTPALRPAPKVLPRPAPVLGQAVRDPDSLFAFAVPRGWRVQHGGGKSSAIEPEQRFRVSCSAAPARARTLGELAQSLMGRWRRSVPGWRLFDQQTLRVADHPCARIRASGTPDGVAMLADYYVVLTPTHQLVLTFERTEASAGNWPTLIQQIAASFQIRQPTRRNADH